MSKKPKPTKEKKVSALIEDADRIRKDLEAQVYRRDDGVLQCPKAYAEGYGIQDIKHGI